MQDSGSTTGGGGGLPPTDTGVCSISPSDLVGYTGNALNRIKELEQRVTELEAKIVEVSQLSNLGQQVGWVGGVTYLGVSGWTQTEYGTLIPPPGVTLAQLGIIPPVIPGFNPASLGISMVDADGNIVFGFNETDGAYGTGPDSWGGAVDYARVEYNNSLSGPSVGNITETRGSIWTVNTLNSSEIKVTVSEAGFYLIDALASMGFVSPPSSFLGGLVVACSSDPAYDSPEELYRDYIVTAAGGGVSVVDPHVSRQVLLGAGDYVRAERVNTGSPHVEFMKLNICRISS